MPTTTTSTLGSGGDYANLAAFNTARNTAASSGDTERLEVLAGTYASTELQGSLTGWTAGVTVEIVAQDGPGTVVSTGATQGIALTSDFPSTTLIADLDLSGGSTSNFQGMITVTGTQTRDGTVSIRNCKGYGVTNTTTTYGIRALQDMGGFDFTLNLDNVLWYGNDAAHVDLTFGPNNGDAILRVNGSTYDGDSFNFGSFGKTTPLTYDIQIAGSLLKITDVIPTGGNATTTLALVDVITSLADPSWATQTNCTFGVTFNDSGDPSSGEVSWTDAASGDYTLVAHADNLAIDYATNSTLYATDLAGETRDASPDAGAYEEVTAVVQPAPSPTDSSGTMGVGWNPGPISYFGSCRPFLNIFKHGAPPISILTVSPFTYDDGRDLDLNANEYSQSLLTNQSAVYIILSNAQGAVSPSGTYIMTFGGDFTFAIDGSTNLAEISTGRWSFDWDGETQIRLRITAITTTPSDVAIVLDSNETLYLAGEIFDPVFLGQMSGVPVVRCMDWLKTNDSAITDTLIPEGRATYGGDRGVPVSVCVALANKLSCDLWYCVPHLATDSYCTAVATPLALCSGNVYVEYSNEVWNSLFTQTAYAIAQGAGLPGASSTTLQRLFFQAKRSAEIWVLMSAAGLTAGSKMKRVLASQAALVWGMEQMMETWDSGSMALVVDDIAIAPYVNVYPDALSKDFVKGRTVAEFWGSHVAADTSEEDGMATALASATTWTQEHVDLGYSQGLILYEGGQHVNAAPDAQSDTDLLDYLEARQQDTEMGTLYTDYLTMLDGKGVAFSCLFSLEQYWGAAGYWGAFEGTHGTPTNYVKWNAIQAWVNPVTDEALPGFGFGMGMGI